MLARVRRPCASTADRGSVTGPIRNYLINDNFINKLSFMFELKYVCHVCIAGYDVIVIGRVVLAELRQYWLSRILAELRQYWPSYSVSAEFITHMIRNAFAIYILYY